MLVRGPLLFKLVFRRGLFCVSQNGRHMGTVLMSDVEPKFLTSSSTSRYDLWCAARERRHQMNMSPRVEKISVSCNNYANDPITLHMVKNISTPLDCAKHLSESIVNQSIVALVNETVPWDMNRPLSSDCTLTFVNFKDSYTDPSIANQAFWNSCSFLAGALLERSFHHEHNVRLVNFHLVEPKDGGFVCDFRYTPNMDSERKRRWIASDRELHALSVQGQRMAHECHLFEVIDVRLGSQLFESLFGDDRLRMQLLTDQCKTKGSDVNKVSVYCMKDFVETFANNGPLMASTKFIGKFCISSIVCLGHLRNSSQNELVYRACGIALPVDFLAHFTTFSRLRLWAQESNLNSYSLPDYVVAD